MTSIWELVGISSIVSIVVSFVFKQSIQHYFDRKIEATKSENERGLNALKEKHESKIQEQAAVLDEIVQKNSRLHSLQLSVIETLMDSLGRIQLCIPALLEGKGEDDSDRWSLILKDVHEAYADFQRIVLTKSWCLPENCKVKLDEVRSKVFEVIFDSKWRVQYAEKSDPKFNWELFNSSKESINNEIPDLKIQLEAYFMEIAGTNIQS